MAHATANKLIALEGATFTMREKQLMMGGSDELEGDGSERSPNREANQG